jgi:hypothetical protein
MQMTEMTEMRACVHSAYNQLQEEDNVRRSVRTEDSSRQAWNVGGRWQMVRHPTEDNEWRADLCHQQDGVISLTKSRM